MLGRGLRMAPKSYNFETASAYLAQARPKRLVFLWDHPVDPILHPDQLAGLGRFFLKRAGEDVAVDPVVLRPGEDPNARLLQGDGRRSALLWVYDTAVHGTAAVAHPPDLSRLQSAGPCRRYGAGRFNVVACAGGG